MRPVPILFYGDSPSLASGLGRIGRDLAVLTAALPQFRVGYLGRGGVALRKLPFMQYTFPESAQWGEDYIAPVWREFAGDEPGAILTIWDASRLLWFSRPEFGLAEYKPELAKFLESKRFEKWGYFPVDAEGPNGILSARTAAAMQGYDRVLAYTEWSARLISRTLHRSVDWIPHGIQLRDWQPRDRGTAREMMGFDADDLVIGCVMTNQPRKDWGIAFQTVALLRQKHPNVKFWAHVDLWQRDHAWNMNALMDDYGLHDANITISGSMNDDQLAHFYSGCDVTILPSSEGFGYPIVESLACGTPCIHGSYGGGAELLPISLTVVPCAYRLEGLHNSMRPVFDARNWVEHIEAALGRYSVEQCRAMIEHLDWSVLFRSHWIKWLRRENPYHV